MEQTKGEQDVLVIDDMNCMRCKKGDCIEQNKKLKKYEKKQYDEWINKKI